MAVPDKAQDQPRPRLYRNSHVFRWIADGAVRTVRRLRAVLPRSLNRVGARWWWIGVAVGLALFTGPEAAWAKKKSKDPMQTDLHQLNTVIGNVRWWVVGILATLATLFLTIGGLRYLAAGGDPGEIERAKTALKSAAIGYALAVLAPLVLSILGHIVSTS